jgi:ubiquinone biosynthesis protein UbiJ
MSTDAAISTLVGAIVVVSGIAVGLAWQTTTRLGTRIDAQGAGLRAEIHAQTTRIDAQTARIDHLADEVAGVKVAVGNLDTRLSHVEHAA